METAHVPDGVDADARVLRGFLQADPSVDQLARENVERHYRA